MPEYEIMLMVETSVTYTIEADSQAEAIEEAYASFSPYDVDVQSGDVVTAYVETAPGSSHFVLP